MTKRALIGWALVLATYSTLSAPDRAAAGEPSCGWLTNTCRVEAHGERAVDGSTSSKRTTRLNQTSSHRKSGATESTGTSDGEEKDDTQAWAEAMQAALDRKVAAHEQEVRQYQHCLQTWEGAIHINTTGPACAIPEPLDLGGDATSELRLIREPSADRPAGAPPVTLPPRQLAYMAVAQLRLTPPTPGIGPPPRINKWKMAAVGYPLWLWVDGDLDPAPVSQSVLDLTVALDARVKKVDFDMGDGNTVTCQGGGTKWGEWVEPGQKSPDCGYSYQTPSLPKGSYTVTGRTHWDVGWNINGQTGTIPLVQVSSTDLPVGELQALVR